MLPNMNEHKIFLPFLQGRQKLTFLSVKALLVKGATFKGKNLLSVGRPNSKQNSFP